MKTVKLSVELRLLVQMVQQELWQVNIPFDTKGINWDTFSKSCAYHGLRSLAFSADQKQSVLPDQMADQLRNFTQHRAQNNLQDVL